MIIKQVKLHNIRSYLDETIDFPLGSTLLSGDIGSGKSTILLAIEFALFGLQRGIVDGSSLLRHDKAEGYIELNLIIKEQPITITRSLKRNKNTRTVVQASASIVVDGQKKELTATELKSFVLNILNYPAALLTKRNLIYRYTVYCPQEEMKRIVLESVDDRLDTLRKVFDIDRYKRILSNSTLFVSQLKEKKKQKEGQLVDLPFKKTQLKEKDNGLKTIKEKIQNINPLLMSAQNEVNQFKDKIRQEREAVEKVAQTKAKVASFEATISEKTAQLKTLEAEEQELGKTIETLRAELKDYSSEKGEQLKNEMIKMEKELQNQRDNEKNIERELAAFGAKKESLVKNSEKISSLGAVCPVCEQSIPEEHKEKIKAKIEPELKQIESEITNKQYILNESYQTLKNLEQSLKETAEKEKALSVLAFKLTALKEKEQKKINAINGITEIKTNLAQMEKAKLAELILIEQYKDLEDQHKQTQEKLEQKQREEKQLLMEKAGLDQSLKDVEREIADLQHEIEKKEKVSTSLNKLEELQNFLTRNFAMLIELMEKQVMLRLNREFNVLFRQWFAALVEDPGLEASVDVDFSPLIEQAGYEINYRYLSGGERTALALAYRLALNQVINSMLSKLNTKNLLILDEPTDGFSSEQLDKIRDVLHELKAEQIILVSHETKIESFVQNVIRFVKQGHVSKMA